MAKYPNVTVQLTGEDGNAFFILGRISKAMRKEGIRAAEVQTFMVEAMAGDYDHLLQTCMAWVDVQ